MADLPTYTVTADQVKDGLYIGPQDLSDWGRDLEIAADLGWVNSAALCSYAATSALWPARASRPVYKSPQNSWRANSASSRAYACGGCPARVKMSFAPKCAKGPSHLAKSWRQIRRDSHEPHTGTLDFAFSSRTRGARRHCQSPGGCMMPDSLNSRIAAYREASADFLGTAFQNLIDAGETICDAACQDDGVKAVSYDWLTRLADLRRELHAAEILLRAGYRIGQSLPPSAAPGLQELKRCRSSLPSPTYDHKFKVVIEEGRAFIVEDHLGVHHPDRHYFEWIAGSPCALGNGDAA